MNRMYRIGCGVLLFAGLVNSLNAQTETLGEPLVNDGSSTLSVELQIPAESTSDFPDELKSLLGELAGDKKVDELVVRYSKEAKAPVAKLTAGEAVKFERLESLLKTFEEFSVRVTMTQKAKDPLTRIVPLQFLDVRAASKVIGSMLNPGATQLSLDERTNSLILRGDQLSIQQIVNLVEKIDSADGGGESTERIEWPKQLEHDGKEKQINVVQLREADATEAAGTIMQLFGYEGVRVSVEPTANRIIVAANAAKHGEILEILRHLDSNSKHTRRVAQEPARRSAGAALTAEAARELRQHLAGKERECLELASKAADDDQMRTKLHRLVEDAFGLQQQLYRSQLVGLNDRVEQLQRRIEVRESQMERFVANRVDALCQNARHSSDAIPLGSGNTALKGLVPQDVDPHTNDKSEYAEPAVVELPETFMAWIEATGIQLRVEQIGPGEISFDGGTVKGAGEFLVRLSTASVPKRTLRARADKFFVLEPVSADGGLATGIRFLAEGSVEAQLSPGSQTLRCGTLHCGIVNSDDSSELLLDARQDVSIESNEYKLSCQNASLDGDGVTLSRDVEIVRLKDGKVDRVDYADRIRWDLETGTVRADNH